MTMDSFFASLSSQETMSLQEMLDMDADNDISEIFSFDLHKLPTINLDDDSLGAPGDNNVWLTSSSDGNTFLGGDVSNSLGSDLSAGETRMVCPNSVMPVTLIEVPYDKSSPKPALSARSILSDKISKSMTPNVRQSSPVYASDALDVFSGQLFIKKEQYPDEEDEDQVDYGAPTSFKNFAVKSKARLDDSPRSISNGMKKPAHSLKTLNGKRQKNSTNDLNLMPSAYPKPAYSYSCLIAMALKNSPSGSLPVSEIYNFMCEHFPYFKTAPNGWKNSVRHNLSLNKCFEKIEKPATNGSQRKGCLWAMNPNKVNKMDEEVQKWSKKDKSAIRKSMIYPGAKIRLSSNKPPESLDALERGQLVTRMTDGDSDDDQWDGNVRVDDVSTEEDDEEEDEKFWKADEKLLRISADDIQVKSPATADEDCDSDMSLTDLDIELAESFYQADASSRSGKVNVQVKVATSPIAFKPLLSGAYTVNSTATTAPSPKRLKTIAGSTISGNYVYKPLSSASLQKKSPIRHSLLSSLEADD